MKGMKVPRRGGRWGVWVLVWSVAIAAPLVAESRAAFATCPAPHAAQTVINVPTESYYSLAESVFRASHSTSGDYAIVLRSGRAYEGALSLQFSGNHVLAGGTVLGWPPNDLQVVGLDAVDIGGSGSNRWVVQWTGTSPDWNRPLARIGTYNNSFQTPWAPVAPLWPPLEIDESQREVSAVDLLPTTRRLVHVAPQAQFHPPNTCHPTGTRREWRVLMAVRDSATGAPVPGLAKQYVSNTCSYHPDYEGLAGRGQDYPDVSTSWFFGDWFVVVWRDLDQHHCGIYARVFYSNGVPITGNILVDQPTLDCNTYFTTSPRVAAAGTAFVVVWGRADQQIMMRTFDIVGNPLIAARPVNTQTLPKKANPDVAIAVSDPCGVPQVYIAVSWWASIGSGSGPWNPQMMVYQDFSDPTPVIPGAGYLPLEGGSQSRFDPWSDRVSIDFFNKTLAADSACSDLTIGASWTMTQPNKSVDFVRKRIIRFEPVCLDALSSGSSEAESGFVDASALGCEEPECFLFYPQSSPPSEPTPVFPEQEMPE